MNQLVEINQSFGFPAQHNYPVKLVSKSLPASRTTRLRFSWFTLGVLSSLTFNTILSSPTEIPIAQVAEIPAPVVEKIIANDKAAPEVTPVIAALEMPAEPAMPVALSSDTPAPQVLQVAEAAAQFPMKLTLTLEKGDTLSTLLGQLGVASAETEQVIKAVRQYYNPKKLTVGQDIDVHLDKNPADASQPIVKSLTIPMSVISSLEVIRKPDQQFLVTKHDAKLSRKPVHVSGKINSSLYETGMETGIPTSMISSIINAYSYDVDFQREIQSGDQISVLFEKLETDDGKTAGYGDIIFAKLITGNETHTIYRYVDTSGDADFYNDKGESVRKGLLRTPINGARITSRFGMRKHPILGYSKMHRGVDFGAATGTPIYAAGDGVVNYMGRNGSYGNYLRIRHNDSYSTAYGHIHRFASGVANGKKVKQGQIVAYVGSTGRSTGPHLHYEVLSNGNQVNPSGVKFKTGNVLRGTELAQFKKQISQVTNTIAALDAETKVAMLDKKQPTQQ